MEWITEKLFVAWGALTTAEYWSGILTSFVLLFIRHRIKLPKTTVSGGGSGSSRLPTGEEFGYHQITVTNDPLFFGYPINRDELSGVSARVFDPTRGTYESPEMLWQGEAGSEVRKVDIKAGESKVLFICGILNKRPHYYVGRIVANIEKTETLVELGQSRKLEVHLSDRLNRVYKIPFRISAKEQRNSIQKVHVSLRVKTTLGDRFRQLRQGLRDIWNALVGPSY